MPNPAVQILIWILIATALQVAQPGILLPVCAVLLIGASQWAHGRLMKLLSRTRWVMISLLAIYAWATPGDAVWEGLAAWSPTREGLLDGAVQLLRLIGALAALAILLSRLSQQQLIGGLYALAYPLQGFGDLRTRLAVRLSLTLRYAEQLWVERKADWRAELEACLTPVQTQSATVIEIERMSFHWRDTLYLAFAGAFLIGVWL